jgi:hypothetical protein
MPNPIQTVRTAIHIVNVVSRSGKTILRLVVPIISVVTTLVQELKKKN